LTQTGIVYFPGRIGFWPRSISTWRWFLVGICFRIMKRNAALRYLYMGAGLLSIGLAIVGAVLPVLPTVPLVLLAGFFFSRSSERFDRWLLEHAVFGPIIRDWRAGLGFTVRAKLVAAAAIIASFGLTLVLVIDSGVGRAGMITLAIAVIAYVVTRPTKRLASETE
jgi:uncharacterized membrane protein YbaN (DUF454 family)